VGEPPAGGESGGSKKPTRKPRTKAEKHDAAVKGYDVAGKPDALREAWAAFCAERRDRGDYLTSRAISMLWKKLDAVGPEVAAQALRDSVANGWKGVFPDKAKAGRPGLQPHDHPNSWRGSARYRETDAEALAEKKRKRLERERRQREQETDR
jgi:hypothetical protein